MEITIILKNWIAIIAAAAGLILSLYNFFKARKTEGAEKRQEEMDWAMYVEHIRKQKNNPAPIVIMPKLGSEEHKWAERMVAKGFLERNPLLLGYCLKHANCS